MTLRVLTLLDHDVEVELVRGIEAHPDLTVVRRCADVEDLLAAAAAGLGECAVVSPGVRSVDRDVLARLAQDGLHVVGVTRRGDEADERRLRQLGVATCVRSDAGLEDLQILVDDLAAGSGVVLPPEEADTDLEADRPLGRVVAVWGPKGSPGVTTTAVNLAAVLAARGREVLLVDADTWGASVAAALAIVDEAPGIAAACRAADHGTLDRISLARIAPVAFPGLRVLTGMPRPDRWPEVREAALDQVLRVARTVADVVVVDCGFSLEDDEDLSYDTSAPRRNAATLTALRECDALVAVGAGDPVSLQRLARGLQDLRAMACPVPVVVVNRVRSSAVGAHPEGIIGAALDRFCGVTDAMFLPDAGPAHDAALLLGEPIARHTPAHPWVQALHGLALRVDPGAAPPTRRSRRRRVWSVTRQPTRA